MEVPLYRKMKVLPTLSQETPLKCYSHRTLTGRPNCRWGSRVNLDETTKAQGPTRMRLAVPILGSVLSLLVPPRADLALCGTDVPSSQLVNISWRDESTVAETVVPSVSLTRSRDGSTGTATFLFERPQVLLMDDVWNNGLITGIWLQDEEGSLDSKDLSVKFENGRPWKLEAILVLKSPDEWERFMRFMRRYAETSGLEFERSAAG